MKKIISSALTLGGVIAVSWWMGGMMYFIMVAKHFRDEENNENTKDSPASNTSGRMPSGIKPDIKASAEIQVPNPTRYPKTRPIDPLQGIKTHTDKWRTYYYPDSKPDN